MLYGNSLDEQEKYTTSIANEMHRTYTEKTSVIIPINGKRKYQLLGKMIIMIMKTQDYTGCVESRKLVTRSLLMRNHELINPNNATYEGRPSTILLQRNQNFAETLDQPTECISVAGE